MIRTTQRQVLLWIGLIVLFSSLTAVIVGAVFFAPVAAQRPTPTNVPDETATPVPTEEPRPSPTEPPTPTEEPAPTEEPEPTAEPQPTDEPEPTQEAVQPTATATAVPIEATSGESLPLTGVGLSLVLAGGFLIMIVLIVRPLRKHLRSESDSAEL
jgi:cytoskeletal protein RodZ